MGLLDFLRPKRELEKRAVTRPRPSRLTRSDHDISKRRSIPLFASQTSLRNVRDVDFWRQKVLKFIYSAEGQEDISVLRVPLKPLGYVTITDFISEIPAELYQEYERQDIPDESIFKDDKVFWVHAGIAEPGIFKWQGDLDGTACIGLQLDRKKAVPFGIHDGKGLFYCKPGHRALVRGEEVIPYRKFLRSYLGLPERRDSLPSSVRMSAKALAAKNAKAGDRVYLPKERKWATVQWIGKIDNETVVDLVYERPKPEDGKPVSPDEPPISRSMSMADFINELESEPTSPRTPVTTEPGTVTATVLTHAEPEPRTPTTPVSPPLNPNSGDLEHTDEERSTSDEDDDSDSEDDDETESESEQSESEEEVEVAPPPPPPTTIFATIEKAPVEPPNPIPEPLKEPVSAIKEASPLTRKSSKGVDEPAIKMAITATSIAKQLFKKPTAFRRQPSKDPKEVAALARKPSRESKESPAVARQQSKDIQEPAPLTTQSSKEVKESPIFMRKPSRETREQPTFVRRFSGGRKDHQAIIKQSSKESKEPPALARQPSKEKKEPPVFARKPSRETKEPPAFVRKPSTEPKESPAVVRQPSREVEEPPAIVRQPSKEIQKPESSAEETSDSSDEEEPAPVARVQADPVTSDSEEDSPPAPIQRSKGLENFADELSPVEALTPSPIEHEKSSTALPSPKRKGFFGFSPKPKKRAKAKPPPIQKIEKVEKIEKIEPEPEPKSEDEGLPSPVEIVVGPMQPTPVRKKSTGFFSGYTFAGRSKKPKKEPKSQPLKVKEIPPPLPPLDIPEASVEIGGTAAEKVAKKKKTSSGWGGLFKSRSKGSLHKLSAAEPLPEPEEDDTMGIDEDMTPPDNIPTPPPLPLGNLESDSDSEVEADPPTEKFNERQIERPEHFNFATSTPLSAHHILDRSDLQSPLALSPATPKSDSSSEESDHNEDNKEEITEDKKESAPSPPRRRPPPPPPPEDPIGTSSESEPEEESKNTPPLPPRAPPPIPITPAPQIDSDSNHSDSDSEWDDQSEENVEVGPPVTSVTVTPATPKTPVTSTPGTPKTPAPPLIVSVAPPTEKEDTPSTGPNPLGHYLETIKDTKVRNRPTSFGSFLNKIKNQTRKTDGSLQPPRSPVPPPSPASKDRSRSGSQEVLMDEKNYNFLGASLAHQDDKMQQAAGTSRRSSTSSDSSEDERRPGLQRQISKPLAKPPRKLGPSSDADPQGNQEGIELDLLEEQSPPREAPPPPPTTAAPEATPKKKGSRTFSFTFSRKRKPSNKEFPEVAKSSEGEVNEVFNNDENLDPNEDHHEANDEPVDEVEIEKEKKQSITSSFRESFRRTFSLSRSKKSLNDLSAAETPSTPPANDITKPRPLTLYIDNNEAIENDRNFSRSNRPASIHLDIQPWNSRHGAEGSDMYQSPGQEEASSQSPVTSPRNPALSPKKTDSDVPKHRIFTTPSFFIKKKKSDEEPLAQKATKSPSKSNSHEEETSSKEPKIVGQIEKSPPPPLPSAPPPVKGVKRQPSYVVQEQPGSTNVDSSTTANLKSALKQRKEIDSIPNGLQINDRVVWYSTTGPVPGTVQKLFKDGTDKYTAMVKFDRDVPDEPLRLVREGDAYIITVEELITPHMFNAPPPPETPTISQGTAQAGPSTSQGSPTVRFNADVASAAPEESESEDDEDPEDHDLPPPFQEQEVSMACGYKRGIQSQDKSCCLETILFSLFYTTNVFDIGMLYANTRDEDSVTRKARKILRKEIVDPLRRNGLCSWMAVKKLRDAVKPLSDEWQTLSTDAEVMMFILFDRALKLGKFISYSNDMSDFLHQLVVDPKDLSKSTTVQHLFETSLQMMEKLKLKTVPTPALILEMPRSNDKLMQYKAVIPNLSLHISHIMESGPRLCICGAVAQFECLQCSANVGKMSIVYCENCKGTSEVIHFQLTHEPQLSPLNQPLTILDLIAIICVKGGHYFSFVKCGNENFSPWVYYDGRENENPKVCIEQNLGMWLDRLEKYPGRYQDALQYPLLTHILQDSHICVYQPREKSSSV